MAEVAKAETGFDTMDSYIWQRQNMVAQYITTRLFLDLCEATERRQGERVGMRWWEKAYIDLAGAMDTAAEVVESAKAFA